MAQINLLPWRQERREQQKIEFAIIAVVALVIGASVVLGINLKYKSDIADQQSRNQYIKTETKKLDTQITEIQSLQRERARLIERMEVIQNLQGNRPVVVHVFDEMARTLPDGVFYTEVKRTAKSISISGLTESTNRVSNLMRNLDASPWFKDPKLSRVESQSEEGMKSFELSVGVDNPTTSAEEDDENSEG